MWVKREVEVLDGEAARNLLLHLGLSRVNSLQVCEWVGGWVVGWVGGWVGGCVLCVCGALRPGFSRAIELYAGHMCIIYIRTICMYLCMYVSMYVYT